MENQINIGDQNNKQIGQNPTSQSVVPQGKPRINYWIISIISLLAILLLFFVWFFLGRMNQNNLTNRPTQIPTLFPTSTASVSTETISVETIKLQTSSIGDSTTELFFAENDSVYSVRADGIIKKLTTVDGNITSLSFIPGKEDLFIETNYGPTVLEIDGKVNKGSWWILRKNSQKPEKLTVDLSLFGGGSRPPGLLDIEEMTRFEKVYTKENDSGEQKFFLTNLTTDNQ